MNFYPDSYMLLLKTAIRRWRFERKNRSRFRSFPVLNTGDPLVQHHFSECLSGEQQSRFAALVEVFASETPAPSYLAFGSLLGAALYSSRVPWDDDFDVFCFADDYQAIRQKFENDPRFCWIDILDIKGGWIVGSKICWREDLNEEQDHGWPFVDIFWLVPCGGRLVERRSCLTFSPDDFKNSTQLGYGSLRISVPCNHEQLLERSFPEWQRWAVISVYTHITEERVAPRRLKIRREDLPRIQER